MRKLTPDSLREIPEFKLENGIANSTGDNAGIGDDVMEEKEISSVYCCDLLSRAMGRAPAGSAWVTVMGNLNAIAVASLADVASIVLAEGSLLDEEARKKSIDERIPVFSTQLPIYEAAIKIGALLNE